MAWQNCRAPGGRDGPTAPAALPKLLNSVFAMNDEVLAVLHPDDPACQIERGQSDLMRLSKT